LKFQPSGTYESPVIDLGNAQNFTNIRWLPSTSLPSTTSGFFVQAGTTASPDCPGGACTNWSDWTVVPTNNTDPGTTFDGSRYVKYKVDLTTTIPAVSPRLDEFIIDFTSHPVGAGLESSVFDTGNSNSFLKNIAWSETLPSGQDVFLQVATSGNNVDWNYCGYNTCQTNGWLTWDNVTNITSTDDNIYSLAIDENYFYIGGDDKKVHVVDKRRSYEIDNQYSFGDLSDGETRQLNFTIKLMLPNLRKNQRLQRKAKRDNLFTNLH